MIPTDDPVRVQSGLQGNSDTAYHETAAQKALSHQDVGLGAGAEIFPAEIKLLRGRHKL